MPAEGGGPSGRGGDRARPAGPSFVCENLEPRLLLSVYAVTSIDDAGAGSLRQALLDANANAGLDTITFNIAGGGLHTIAPLSALPDIIDAVVLDATSQPGYAGTPVIELNGASAGNNRNGLTLESGSDGSTIRGLAINRFGGDGIHITHSSGNLIELNFIGTDPSGTIAQGNGGDGIEIYFYATNNVIRYNLISANAWGISIGIGSVDDALNIIQANKIGTDVTGTLPLGNTTAGITAGFGSTNTLIGGFNAGQGNIIAFNGIGIELRQNAAGHSFLGNAIFSNGGLGIDLGSDGVTVNDAGDGDSGANNGQNFPVLTSAQRISSTQMTIAGSLNSTANSYFRIEFFANAAADGSGYGEGQRYLGFINVATDGAGNAALSVTLTAAVAPGEFITATATRSDATFSTFTDTSEFAQNIVVVNHIVHTPSVTDALTDEDTQTTGGLVISRDPTDGAEVMYFKITGITNGTLYQNDGTTPIAEGSFITIAEGSAGLKFTPAADFNGSGYFTVQASTSDDDAGLGGGTVTATILVHAVNDAPVLDLDADDSGGRAGADFAATFTEGGPAVGIADTDAILSDVDNAMLSSLTVTITNLKDGAAESLTADTTGTAILAGYDTGTGVLTLSGTDSVAHYQQVLRTIRYRNTAQAPDITARQITFVANDGALNSNVGTATVTILALNNPPVVNDQSLSAAENTAGGTSVGTVVASDPDPGDYLTYAIIAGNTDGTFAINPTTGEITVANPAALDYETHPTFTLTVQVTDSGTPARIASATITIQLTDRNEVPTAIDLFPGRVDENTDTRSGTSVGTLTTTDPDAGDTGTYSIVGGADQLCFRIGGAGNNELILTDGILDYETKSSYQVTVRVTDSGGLSQERTFTVAVNNLNEAPLVNDQSFWVDENAVDGAVVGTVLASDVDAGDRLTYSIAAGNTDGAFAINSTTGQITVANRTALDYETRPALYLTVRVTDTGGLAAEAAVAINLLAVNEAPLLFAPGALFTQRAVPLVFRRADGTGISIQDVDAGAGHIRMEIQVTKGGVTLAGSAGLTLVLGDGVEDAILIFTGTVAAVNAALEGMMFQPQPDYVGLATLQLAVDDQGHSGSGGPLRDTRAVNILVGATPPPPEEPEVPIPPEPDNPEPELPPLDVPEPEPQDLSEGISEPTIPAVPAEEPVVPDAPTVDNLLPRQDTRGDVTPAREPARPAETPKETRADDSGTPPAEEDTSGEAAPPPQERGQGPTDINAASAALAESVHAHTAMWSQVESMKGQMDRAAGMEHRQQAVAVGVATGLSVSFAAGYVIWLLRGGSLLASLLAASPLWKSFDPLPVLAFWEKRKKERSRPGEKDKSNSDDEHELDELFGISTQRRRETGE
ncbi:MAG: cadherin domain-containing protein [Planctomycetes bacterium]|nr:cadherin domain-containing protein [Planctomycetota bacterium]